jgi:hypothetical protein
MRTKRAARQSILMTLTKYYLSSREKSSRKSGKRMNELRGLRPIDALLRLLRGRSYSKFN